MKPAIASIIIGVFTLSSIACQESPAGGTPGTDDSFTLTSSGMPTLIKPGDAQSVKITIHRGPDFHHPIRFETQAPDAVAANLDRNLVKEGDSHEVNVRLRPKEDAAAGDYKVKVAASSDAGTPTTLELNVRVIPK